MALAAIGLVRPQVNCAAKQSNNETDLQVRDRCKADLQVRDRCTAGSCVTVCTICDASDAPVSRSCKTYPVTQTKQDKWTGPASGEV